MRAAAGGQAPLALEANLHHLVVKQDGAVRTGTEDAVEAAAWHGMLTHKLRMQSVQSSTDRPGMMAAGLG